MNKQEFVDEVANRCRLNGHVVEEVYYASFELIAERLIQGESVQIPKWGKFSLKKKKATIYKNLFGKTEKIERECVYPIFQIGKGLKIYVKNGHNLPKIP